MRTGRTLFIVNPVAGAGRAETGWTRFARTLLHSGARFQSTLTHRPGEAEEVARGAAGTHDLVVAVGGDGTVSEVAHGLLSAGPTEAVLGIVPLGTGNDIARSLGIRTHGDSLAALHQGPLRSMDAIRVHCAVDGKPVVRHALGFAAVGITGDLLKRTTQPVKRFLGQRLAYYLGLIRAIWQHRPARMRVTCDAQVWEDRFLFACASNCEMAGGGMRISPGAQSDDGRLNVNLITAVGPWEALGQLRRLRLGSHTSHPKVRYLTASSLTIETEPIIEVAVDGDLIGLTPARFEIQPKALQVAGVPQQFSF